MNYIIDQSEKSQNSLRIDPFQNKLIWLPPSFKISGYIVVITAIRCNVNSVGLGKMPLNVYITPGIVFVAVLYQSGGIEVVGDNNKHVVRQDAYGDPLRIDHKITK